MIHEDDKEKVEPDQISGEAAGFNSNNDVELGNNVETKESTIETKGTSSVLQYYGPEVAKRVENLSPTQNDAAVVGELAKELLRDTITPAEELARESVEDYPPICREPSERKLVAHIASELVEHVPPPSFCAAFFKRCTSSCNSDSCTKRKKYVGELGCLHPKVKVAFQILMILVCVYMFLIGLELMGSGFKVVAGDAASSLFGAVDDPFVGLMIGILATALVQSSSTSTSIVVTMVGSGLLSVRQAIPIILGTNIGTSMTSTAVSLTFANDRENYRRGFAGAILHGVFNVLTVTVFFLLEVISDAANAGDGGALELVTAEMLGDGERNATEGGAWTSPFTTIVKPFTSLFLQVDKRVLEDWSLGRPNITDCLVPGLANGGGLKLCALERGCVPRMFETPQIGEIECEQLDLVQSCSESGIPSFGYCISPNVVNSSILDAAQSFYDQLNVLKGGVFYDNDVDSGTAGIVTLVVAILLLLFALIALVKLLQALLLHTSKKALAKRLDINGYVAMILGTGITILFQSSSVTTSILTPLVAVGIISLNTMLPFCIGANIGTTVTALIAAVAAAELVAMQIALCHVLINVGGALIWYPVPALRHIPKRVAKKFGDLAAEFSWFPPLVLGSVFGLYPMLVIGLALLLQNSDLVGVGIGLIVVVVVGHLGFGGWIKYGNGAQVLRDRFKTHNFVADNLDEKDEES